METNGKILYIEPNLLQDPTHENIPFDYEDLCIALDIEVRVPDRYSCGNKEYNIYASHPNRTISFLRGTDGMLTTSFTDISARGDINEGNPETLGIKSINVSYTSAFFPQVTIQFCDVRASSLMQPMEEEYVNSLSKNGQISQGSFFRALFTFPYPMFVMKLKGYYGKAIKYDLVVSDFKADFDASEGNFNVTVSFIGYMYGIYTDIPFRYLMIAPYFRYGKKTWDYTFDDGTPMPTFLDVSKRIGGLAKDVNKTLQSEKKVKIYKSNKKKIERLKNIKANYEELIDSFGKKGIDYFPDGTGDCILITGVQGTTNGENDIAKHSSTIFEAICQNIIDYNEYSASETDLNGTGAKYFIESWDVKNKKSNDGIWKTVSVYEAQTVNTSGILTYLYWEGSNIPNDASRFECDINHVNDIANTVIKKAEQLELTEVKGYFFKGRKLKDECEAFISRFETENDKLEQEIKALIKTNTEKILGFSPSVKNVVKMSFAHLDCFMNSFYTCTQAVRDTNRSFQSLKIGRNNTDCQGRSKTESFVPPFPLILDYERTTVYPSKVNGINLEQLPEIDFVEDIVATAQGRLTVSKSTASNEYFATLLTDLLNLGNPYTYLSDTGDEISGINNSICAMYANRFFSEFGVHTTNNRDVITNGPFSGQTLQNAVKSFAQLEAYNIYKIFKGNKQIRNSLPEMIKNFSNSLNSSSGNHIIPNITTAIATSAGTYNWSISNTGMNLVSYNNIEDAKDALTPSESNFEGSTKVYPISIIKTESYNDLPTVFKIDDTSFKLNQVKESSSLLMVSVNKFVSGDTPYLPFKHICDNETTIKEKVFQTNISHQDISGWWSSTTENLPHVSASKLVTSYLEGKSTEDKLDKCYVKQLNFSEGGKQHQLMETLFFKEQSSDYAKALLFLECLPLEFDNIILEGDVNTIKSKTITPMSRATLVLLGGLIWYELGGFTIERKNGEKEAPWGLYLCGESGSNYSTVLSDKSSSKYKYEDTGLFAPFYTNLKWPVKQALINEFKDWVAKDFDGILKSFRLYKEMDDDILAYFKYIIDNKNNFSSNFFKTAICTTLSENEVKECVTGDSSDLIIVSGNSYFHKWFIKKDGRYSKDYIGKYEISQSDYTELNKLFGSEDISGNTEKQGQVIKILFSTLGTLNSNVDMGSIKSRTDEQSKLFDFDYTKDAFQGVGLPLINTCKYTFASGEVLLKTKPVKWFLISRETTGRVTNSGVKTFASQTEIDTYCINNKITTTRLSASAPSDVFTYAWLTGSSAAPKVFPYSKDGVVSMFKNNESEATKAEKECYTDNFKNVQNIVFSVECPDFNTNLSEKVEQEVNIVGRNLIQLSFNQVGEALKTLFNDETKNETEKTKEVPVESTDMYLSTYLQLKGLYDKWLCSLDRSYWKPTPRVEGKKRDSEYSKFKFIDSYYHDISDTLFVDINTLSSVLDRLEVPEDTDTFNPSVYEFWDELAHATECSLIATPASFAFDVEDEEEYAELFKPQPFSEMVAKDDAGPQYLWVYSHNPSYHLDIEESDYADDGLDLADSNGNANPVLPVDLIGDNIIPAFGVTFGMQNQSLFKSYSIDMSNFQQTEFSIKNNLAIADSYGKNAQVANFVSQNLYHVYSNYSYSISVEMMGDTCISPMMYFQLNNIPMFKGAYYITDVKHSVTPDGMTTSFTGVRINKHRMPIVSQILLLSDIEDIKPGDEDDYISDDVPNLSLYRKTYSICPVGELTLSSQKDFVINSATTDLVLKVGNESNWKKIQKLGKYTINNEEYSYSDLLGAIGQSSVNIGYTPCIENIDGKILTISAYDSNKQDVTHALFDMICLTETFYIAFGSVTLQWNSSSGTYKIKLRAQQGAGSGIKTITLWNDNAEMALADFQYNKEDSIDALYSFSKEFVYTLAQMFKTYGIEAKNVIAVSKFLDKYRCTDGKESFEDLTKRIVSKYGNTLYRG